MGVAHAEIRNIAVMIMNEATLFIAQPPNIVSLKEQYPENDAAHPVHGMVCDPRWIY
jgi:hypothetical protein